ncbi:MAG: electron transfer flavoprotein subunit beta/FixA family protein [Desulfobacterales bacterium]
MNILVCVKPVPDFDRIIASENIYEEPPDPLKAVDDDTELSMNRFDESAVEEAVLIKEKFGKTHIDIVSCGPDGARKAVKRAIGMGADQGIHIKADYTRACDAMQTAQAIAAIASEKPYDLILTGVMSEDMMQFQVGPMLAAYLDIPWASAVVRADLDPEKSLISVEQEREGGARALIELDLPALVTIQTGINLPRYPSLSNMLRANKTGIPEIAMDSLDLGDKSYKVAGYAPPEKKRAGRVIDGTPEEKAKKLIHMLKQKSLLP